MKSIRIHTKGNTWKYTIDIFNIRIVFKRLKAIDKRGRAVPHFKISL